MKRFRAVDRPEYQRRKDENTREWLEWSEKMVSHAINDCIEILEKLHRDYDRYYERVALRNAIRLLEQYEQGEEVK